MNTLKLKEEEHNSPFTNLDGSVDIVSKQITVAFTGTRNGMSDAQKEKVKSLLIDLKPDKALHGMCIGADEDFHNICKELGIYIEGYPGKSATGDNVTYRSTCEPNITHEEDTHFSRNRKIVDMCNVLIACPFDKSQTGGTWYTIKYADKQDKNLIIVYRDGNLLSII